MPCHHRVVAFNLLPAGQRTRGGHTPRQMGRQLFGAGGPPSGPDGGYVREEGSDAGDGGEDEGGDGDGGGGRLVARRAGCREGVDVDGHGGGGNGSNGAAKWSRKSENEAESWVLCS